MTGAVRIAILIVRIAGRHPMTVPMGRVTVVATNPEVLSVAPFVMSGNPDGRLMRALPLRIIFPIAGRSLISDVDAK